MGTTSIRLPDELKQRIARAAEHAGLTPQAFMFEAIAERLGVEERRSDLQAVAEQRYEHILDTGETIPCSAMRDYLKRRFAGEALLRPKPVKRDLRSDLQLGCGGHGPSCGRPAGLLRLRLMCAEVCQSEVHVGEGLIGRNFEDF